MPVARAAASTRSQCPAASNAWPIVTATLLSAASCSCAEVPISAPSPHIDIEGGISEDGSPFWAMGWNNSLRVALAGVVASRAELEDAVET